MIRSKYLRVNKCLLLLVSLTITCCNTSKKIIDARGESIPAPFVVPPSFSPNGDGIDEVWNIEGLSGYPRAEINLYTVYGQLVYCSTGKYKAWDGTHKGEKVPAGNYYYVIKRAKKMRVTDGWMRLVR